MHPNTFRPGRVRSPISPPLKTPTFCLLLYFLTKRWPPMAETPPFTLLFNGLRFDASNKRTSPSESAPDAARLAWSHREQLCQDLGPWLMLPWREGEEEPLGVGWRSRSSCFFVLCMCVLLFLCIFGFNSYEASYVIP